MYISKKEISHKSILKLAEFYGVSTDYLLCATENRNRPDAGLTELHINDDMVELLKSGHINNRLLCEIATHEEWDAILRDIRLDHEADAESAPNDSSTLKMIADVEKAMRFQGNALDKFCYVMCSQLQISYEKLTEKERTDLKNSNLKISTCAVKNHRWKFWCQTGVRFFLQIAQTRNKQRISAKSAGFICRETSSSGTAVHRVSLGSLSSS